MTGNTSACFTSQKLDKNYNKAQVVQFFLDKHFKNIMEKGENSSDQKASFPRSLKVGTVQKSVVQPGSQHNNVGLLV